MTNWALLFAAILFAGWLWFGESGAIDHPPGVLAAHAPYQGDIGRLPKKMEKPGYVIEPLARFSVEARVLRAEHYYLDRGADLAPVDLVVGDLSFISLELVLDPLIGVTAPDGDLALMVKPQFEVGKGRVGKGGVVREPELREAAVRAVAVASDRRGWGARAVTVSPLPGPSGNVEFFLWLRKEQPSSRTEVEQLVRTAVEAGPR